MFFVCVVVSSEMADVFSVAVVLNDVIQSVTIGYIDIAVGRDRRFGWFEGIILFIDSDRAWVTDRKDKATIERES